MNFEKRALVTSDSNVALAIAMVIVFGSIAFSIAGFVIYRWWMKQKVQETAVRKESVATLPEIEELPSFFASKTLKRVITGEKRRSYLGDFDLKRNNADPSIPLSEIRMDMAIPEEPEEIEQTRADLSSTENQHHTVSQFSKDSFGISMEEVETPSPKNSNSFPMMPEVQEYDLFALAENGPISPKPQMPLPSPPATAETVLSVEVSPESELPSYSPMADMEPQEKSKQLEQTHLASPPLSPVATLATSPVKVAVAPKGLSTTMSPTQNSPAVDDEDSDEDDTPLGANMSQEQMRKVSHATIVLPSNPRNNVRRTSTTSSLRYEL